MNIDKKVITELSDGNYFSDETAVKYDLQNGKINVVAYCICKKTAEDMAKGLNLYDNVVEELDANIW
tara:strand:- start:112 stop:312 length:201 start_codon:yes stop_codon:yes gene_type:complete